MRPIIVISALVVLIAGWFVLNPGQNKATPITLTFHAQMGDEPLIYDQFIYDNPGGQGLFRVRDFRFYLSNLSFGHGDETYAEPESYHLLRFDNADSAHSITLPAVPLPSIETVRFLIGVDPAANSSIEVRGDLDPNSQMAWNWEVGYKFVVFEGALQVGEDVSPLVYHVGFSENAREVEFSVPAEVLADGKQEVHLTVDLAKLFDNAVQIDMQALPSVKFNRTDAEVLANNYANMVAPSF
ncbi:MbnP family protein [Ruegeria arenilitoris]|uniref:MbnP family protein n=1 Tax=Ruegeria arenilitoris TaxID=1173585 RepID=UPI00147FBB9B|nr:MbnP family protein [Ruegeria arenilitoris]